MSIAKGIKQSRIQTPYTKLAIKRRRTGAVKAPLSEIRTPLDKIAAASPYPRPW